MYSETPTVFRRWPAVRPEPPAVEVTFAATVTSGGVGRFTYSAHTNGKIYVENRRAGPPIKVSLLVIGAPLL